MEKKIPGVPTGVGSWYQMLDDDSGRFFFYNAKTKKVSWGLPLRDIVTDAELASPYARHGKDDWECCIDAQSGKKFYQSKKINRIQWQPPLVYRPRLMKLQFFADRRVSTVGEEPVAKVSTPVLRRQASLQTLMNHISIESVLEDSTCCSAFHRYLVSVHAEENLLFWAACEVFRLGSWKGMKTLGIREGGVVDTKGDDTDDDIDEEDAHAQVVHDEEDEGQMMLQDQLARTHASVRIGMPIGDERSLSQEARTIYDRFIKPGAPMEICIDAQSGKGIIRCITSGKVDRTLFHVAQEEVLRNMEEDLLPRFLAVALSEDGETVGQGEFIFESDEVVRRALTAVAAIDL